MPCLLINHRVHWYASCNVKITRSHLEYGVIEWDTSVEFDPVILLFRDPDRIFSVRTAMGAANARIREFPSDDGGEFLLAIKICLDVMKGNVDPEQLTTAIIRAAEKAGVTAIAVLH